MFRSLTVVLVPDTPSSEPGRWIGLHRRVVSEARNRLAPSAVGYITDSFPTRQTEPSQCDVDASPVRRRQFPPAGSPSGGMAIPPSTA